MLGGLRKTRIVFEVAICLPKAPGCQLFEAATSAGCRFSGSSRTSNGLTVCGRYTDFSLTSLWLSVRFRSQADICSAAAHVRFGPIADIANLVRPPRRRVRARTAAVTSLSIAIPLRAPKWLPRACPAVLLCNNYQSTHTSRRPSLR